MTIQDEQGKRSRWEHMLRQIKACDPMVERLRQQGVEVRWFTFAEDLQIAELILKMQGRIEL